MRTRPEPEHEAVIRLIRSIVEDALEDRLPTTATIVGGKDGDAVTGDGGILVQFDAEDDERTVSFPRVYGVQYRYGDRVAMMASRAGAWVCLGPVGKATGVSKKRVTGEEIARDAITFEGHQLADGSVSSDALRDNAVKAAHMAVNAVETQAIKAGAVTSAKLDQNAVTESKIDGKAVSTAKIADGAVTSAKLDGGAVKSANLDNGSVTTDKIANRAVTSNKLEAYAANSSGNTIAGAVTSNVIVNGAVTSEKIANRAIGSAKLEVYAANAKGETIAGAVTTDVIVNNAISTDKIANKAVKAIHIDDKAITSRCLESVVDGQESSTGAVTGDKIQDGTITNRKIKDGTISASKLNFSPSATAQSTTHTTQSGKSLTVAFELDKLWLYQRCIINNFNAAVSSATPKGKNKTLDDKCTQHLIP